ncbi:MAG: hypothetical protein WC845_02775 [Candidatus Staskawiczbacteria bacterium]|jgi:membrane-bound ClpP family serine protease
MLVFFTVALIAFLYVVLGFILGHAHDVGHDILSHDADHEGADGHMISIFSTRVIATFMMAFGAAGGVFKFYNFNYPLSCLGGIGAGIVVSIPIYFLLNFIAKQQSNSLVLTSSLVGLSGVTETAMEGNIMGEVAVFALGRRNIYQAVSRLGKPIAKGSAVRVVRTMGSDLVVEVLA